MEQGACRGNKRAGAAAPALPILLMVVTDPREQGKEAKEKLDSPWGGMPAAPRHSRDTTEAALSSHITSRVPRSTEIRAGLPVNWLLTPRGKPLVRTALERG